MLQGKLVGYSTPPKGFCRTELTSGVAVSAKHPAVMHSALPPLRAPKRLPPALLRRSIGQNSWLIVRFLRAVTSETMSLDLRRSSRCTDCHSPGNKERDISVCSTTPPQAFVCFKLSSPVNNPTVCLCCCSELTA
uniref:Uncharacterized protein n=1 Tax=Gopherus agassizii TaxID=38772 RepID=A0A452IRY3_9SAUR